MTTLSSVMKASLLITSATVRYNSSTASPPPTRCSWVVIQLCREISRQQFLHLNLLQIQTLPKYTQFRLHGLRIYHFLVIFRLYGFLENVFPNKLFIFMDFSLIWTILARTNVVHISGIGCTMNIEIRVQSPNVISYTYRI